jgi:hypothetical protein
MAPGPDALADEVRRRREAVDEDIDRLQARLHRIDPRRFPIEWWIVRLGPPAVAIALALVWRAARHRHL